MKELSPEELYELYEDTYLISLVDEAIQLL